MISSVIIYFARQIRLAKRVERKEDGLIKIKFPFKTYLFYKEEKSNEKNYIISVSCFYGT